MEKLTRKENLASAVEVYLKEVGKLREENEAIKARVREVREKWMEKTMMIGLHTDVFRNEFLSDLATIEGKPDEGVEK